MSLSRTFPGLLRLRISSKISIMILIVLIAFPLVADPFGMRLVSEFAISGLFSVAYNLTLGQLGLFSFGHGGLFGFAGYILAVPVIKGITSFPYALIGALVLTTVLAYLMGWLCLRLTGIYFSILTLAFSQLIWAAAWKFRSLTGGDDGLTGLQVPSFLASPTYQYFFNLAIVAVALVVIKRIMNSPLGYTLKAIRENPRRAASTGINVKRYQLIAFTISGFFTGLAGVLFAMFTRGVFVEFASVSKSFEPVFAVVVGGIYTFTGPILGAGFMLALNHFIGRFTEYWPSIAGFILILMMLFLPTGVTGAFQTWIQRKLAAAIENKTQSGNRLTEGREP